MYHHISPNIKSAISVPPDLFESQIRYLSKNGWKTISVHSALQLMKEKQHPPNNVFILTFDDSYSDFHQHAFPILKKMHMTACVYVITDFVGCSDSWNHRADFFSEHMTWAQLQEILSESIEIGCHTKTHQCLVKLNDTWLREEIVGAQKTLENKLGIPIDLFCYPYGTFDTRVRKAVAGNFAHAFSVEDGTNDWSRDPWSVCRVFVGPRHSPDAVLRNMVSARNGNQNDASLPNDVRKLVG